MFKIWLIILECRGLYRNECNFWSPCDPSPASWSFSLNTGSLESSRLPNWDHLTSKIDQLQLQYLSLLIYRNLPPKLSNHQCSSKKQHIQGRISWAPIYLRWSNIGLFEYFWKDFSHQTRASITVSSRLILDPCVFWTIGKYR
jgi:hypothetical protein